MGLKITLVNVRWFGVVGATGYEIQVDGKKVATAGARARTSRVAVDDATRVTVIDLPKRSLEQELVFSQDEAA